MKHPVFPKRIILLGCKDRKSRVKQQTYLLIFLNP